MTERESNQSRLGRPNLGESPGKSKHINPSLTTRGGAALGKSRGYQFLVNFLFLSLRALANTGNGKDYEDEENNEEIGAQVFGLGGWKSR